MSDIRTTQYDTYCHGKLDLAVLRRDMPCARSLHKELEIVHVKAGELRVVLNEQPVRVQEGETLVIGGFVIHEFVSPKAEVEAVRAKLQPEWLEAPFWDGEERGRFRVLFSGAFVLERDERLKHIFGVVEQCLSQSRPAYRCLISLMELVWLVMEAEGLSIHRLPRGTGADVGMAGALEYLHTHSGEEITLGQLAAYMGMSESYCSKRFHQLMGITFSDFLSTLRVSDARYLLSHTSRPIISIAQEAGFSSIQTFNRVFRRICGQTPTAYRLQASRRLKEGKE